MNPSLFNSSKTGGSLIMHVSSPVVVPAATGSGVTYILQQRGSVGIEKLSMQANKLMPLEDITGKTMQRVAWEGARALEGPERRNQWKRESSTELLHLYPPVRFDSPAISATRLKILQLQGCIQQIGVAGESPNNEAMSVDATKLMQGSLYQFVMKSGTENYLANLSLYPGKSELPFLPPNTQAVILQPLGDKGVVVIGGDTIRGFTTSDQAWITLMGEKIDSTLAKYFISSSLEMQDTA